MEKLTNGSVVTPTPGLTLVSIPCTADLYDDWISFFFSVETDHYIWLDFLTIETLGPVWSQITFQQYAYLQI